MPSQPAWNTWPAWQLGGVQQQQEQEPNLYVMGSDEERVANARLSQGTLPTTSKAAPAAPPV
eukprot:4172835-Heterocapsa_arctica.AAC.1